MHGRLKVKSTAAQAAAKAKEREEKKLKYQAAMTTLMDMRKSKSFDQLALDLTAKILQVNPDSHTVWNFRRETLNDMEREENDTFQDILTKELSVTEMCLLNNVKSYGTWHHRGWVLQKLTNPSWPDELDMCYKYLKLDARNFHCWDHRRVVVRLSNHCVKKELEFTQSLIDANLSNYSAWHYRSQLLPLVHPAATESSLPIDEKIFLKELKNVVSAVFTDPSDQSPWFFLRWLLREKHNQPKLVQVGGFTLKGKYHSGLIFSQSTSLVQLKDILEVENFNMDQLKPFDDQQTIWIFPMPDSPDFTMGIRYGGSIESCKILLNSELQPPTTFSHLNEMKVDDASWAALRDIRDNCLLLEEIDPDNKWVLLTLVDFLKVIDLDAHMSDIRGYLGKLQQIDPLRKKYYADAGNKIIMEAFFRSYTKRGTTQFCLKDQKMRRLCHPHLLAFAETIDLSGNSLESCEWAKYLVSVKDLTIDGNLITDFGHLCCLENLKTLSVVNCSTTADESLKQLSCDVDIKRDKTPEL